MKQLLCSLVFVLPCLAWAGFQLSPGDGRAQSDLAAAPALAADLLAEAGDSAAAEERVRAALSGGQPEQISEVEKGHSLELFGKP